MTYKLINDLLTGKPINYVLKKEGKLQIPFDPANRDYQEYLEWLKIDGNVPEAVD